MLQAGRRRWDWHFDRQVKLWPISPIGGHFTIQFTNGWLIGLFRISIGKTNLNGQSVISPVVDPQVGHLNSYNARNEFRFQRHSLQTPSPSLADLL